MKERENEDLKELGTKLMKRANTKRKAMQKGKTLQYEKEGKSESKKVSKSEITNLNPN